MAFIEKDLPYARLKQFQFFATDGDLTVAPNAEFVESFSPSYAYELENIHLKLATSHASVVDFMITLSHHIDSAYNHNLLSQPMQNHKDVLLQFKPTMKLHSGDTINFSLVMSAVNTYGIKISGWSITSPARD